MSRRTDRVIKAHADAMREATQQMQGPPYVPPVPNPTRVMDDIGTALAWVIGILLLLVGLAVAAYAVRYGWEAGA